MSLSSALTKNNLGVRVMGWTIHDAVHESLLFGLFPVSQNSVLIAFIAFFLKKTKVDFVAKFIRDNQPFIPPPKAGNLFGYFQNKSELLAHRESFSGFVAVIRKRVPSVSRRSCVIHFRQGDSSVARAHAAYYERVRQHCSAYPDVLVVTDSLAAATEFFADFPNCSVVKSKSPLIDFAFMVHARSLYCAPSTLSWWAASLNTHEGAIYIPESLVADIGFVSNEHRIQVL